MKTDLMKTDLLKTTSQVHNPEPHKKLIIFGLYFFAAAIVLSGVFFGLYSYLEGVTLKVLNANVSGVIFGLVVVYFGVRSIISVNKLRPQLFKDDARFSWNNFKKEKTAKNR